MASDLEMNPLDTSNGANKSPPAAVPQSDKSTAEFVAEVQQRQVQADLCGYIQQGQIFWWGNCPTLSCAALFWLLLFSFIYIVDVFLTSPVLDRGCCVVPVDFLLNVTVDAACQDVSFLDQCEDPLCWNGLWLDYAASTEVQGQLIPFYACNADFFVDENGFPNGLVASHFFKYRLLQLIFEFLVYNIILPPVIAASIFGVFNAIRGQNDGKVRCLDMFQCYSGCFPIIVMAMLLGLLSSVMFWFFIVPGVWFTVASCFAFPLIIDRHDIGVCTALGLSIRVTHKSLRMFCHTFLLLCFYLAINFLGALAFGVGIIISGPMSIVIHAFAYHHFFGVRGAQPYARRGAAAPDTI